MATELNIAVTKIGRSLTAVIVVCLLAATSALTGLKLESFQAEDLVLLLLLALCIERAISWGFRVRIRAELNGLFISYVLLLLALLLMALFALRMTFYPLDKASPIKQPVIFSMSKLLQLAAVICGFLWLTNGFIRRKDFLLAAMRVYWIAGIVSAWYAILSYAAITVFHASAFESLGAYTVDEFLRARGFFVEGGPFGVYLVSVFVIGIVRRASGRPLGLLNPVILCVAFALSSSVAGFFVAAALSLWVLLSRASMRTRVLSLCVAIAIVGAAAAWINVGVRLAGYFYTYQSVQENPEGLVTGRISALFIVPRMIATHPWTGIGFGNYPLMRNDPNYLGGLPAVTDIEDLPALGIPGIAAEMGLPATVALMILLFTPYRLCRGKASILVSAALFQPIAHIFGVQITFFYPWFVTACALGASLNPAFAFEDTVRSHDQGKASIPAVLAQL